MDKEIKNATKELHTHVNASSENYELDNLFPHIDTLKTPVFPQIVYQNLPSILKEATKYFENDRERDVVLLGSLGVLSGSFTNIIGEYDGYEFAPNLYVLIVAPPASGKSRMKFAEYLIKPFHNNLIAKYEQEMVKHKATIKKNNQVVTNSPNRKTMFIPGNTSSAAIIKQLKSNNGQGIIFETEADTLTGNFKQDWGNFSELLRSGFQQETIRYQRSGSDVLIEIAKPKFSIVLSGTPDQTKNLVTSVQNGLFSRFTYYTFNSRIELKEISKQVSGVNLTQHFEKLAAQLCPLIEINQNTQFTFEFTQIQFKKSYEFFKNEFNFASTFLGDDSVSLIFRLQLMLFKIAMTLSYLEYLEKGNASNILVCSNETFNTSLEIIKVLAKHSLVVYQAVQTPVVLQENMTKIKFLELLPSEFQAKDVLKAAESVSKSERTCKYWIDDFIKTGYVKKIGHGKYKKVIDSK